MNREYVSVSIVSERSAVKANLFDAVYEKQMAEIGDDVSIMVPEELPGEEQGETLEMITEGLVRVRGGRVEVVYDEGELSGMEGSTTVVSYAKDEPRTVSMIRSGAVSTALVFEPQRRHLCVYNTPFSSFEVCVHTLEVKNDLPSGGALYLDYLIEIHGAKTERCKMTVTVR